METCHNQENITLDKISINEEDNDNLDEGEIVSDDEHVNVLSSDIHINDPEDLETDIVNDEVKDLEEGELEEDGGDEKINCAKGLNSKGNGVHSRVQCKFFSRGNCSWGSNCRFLHSKKSLSSSDTSTNVAQPIYPLMSLCNDLSPLEDDQLFEGPSLSLLSKAGAAKLSNLDGNKSENSKPIPLMKSLINGSIEPFEAVVGVTPNGRALPEAEAVSSPPGEGTAPAPPPESAWERGLRQAKELMKRSADIKSNQLIDPAPKSNQLIIPDRLADDPVGDLTIVVGEEWGGGRNTRYAPYPPRRDASPPRDPRPHYWPPEGYEPTGPPPSRKRYYEGGEDYYAPPPRGHYEGRYHFPPPPSHPYEDYYYAQRDEYDPYGPPPPRRARPLRPHPHDPWGAPPPEGEGGYYHPYPPAPRRSYYYYGGGPGDRGEAYYYRHPPPGPFMPEHSRYPGGDPYNKMGADRTPRAYKRMPSTLGGPGPPDSRSPPHGTRDRDPQGRRPARREGGAMSSHDDVSSVGSIEPAPASPPSARGRGHAQGSGIATPEWHDPWARRMKRMPVVTGGNTITSSGQARKDFAPERGIGAISNFGSADKSAPDSGARTVHSVSSRSSSSRSRSSSSSSSTTSSRASSRSGPGLEPAGAPKAPAVVRGAAHFALSKRPRPPDALVLGVEVSSGEEAALLADESAAPSVKKRSTLGHGATSVVAAPKFERTSSFSSISSFSSREDGVESISDIASCPASPPGPLPVTTTNAKTIAAPVQQNSGNPKAFGGAVNVPALAQQIKMKLVNKPKKVPLTENANKEAFSPLSSDGSDIGESNADQKVGTLNDCLAQSLARKPVASQRYDKLSTVYPLPTPTPLQQGSVEKTDDLKVPGAGGNASATSRREQLLKQLRAVEEAIARKRTK